MYYHIKLISTLWKHTSKKNIPHWHLTDEYENSEFNKLL